MKKNQTLLLGILIICLLTIGIAFLRSPNRSVNPVVTSSRKTTDPALGHTAVSFPNSKAKQWEILKEQEFLGVTSPTVSQTSQKNLKDTTVPYPPGTLNRPHGPSRVETAYQGRKNGNVYQAADRSLVTPASRQSGGKSTSLQTTNGNNTPGSSSGMSVSGGSSLTAEENTKHIMNPFLRGLTKEQAEALNRSLDGLSSRVERAILQAMLPKSKKNANIEKYLQRNQSGDSQSADAPEGGVSGAAVQGPFAKVLKQVSSQKGNITKSMGNAYGAAAAKEAGQIMDSYQKELAAALENKEGKSPEELAKLARAIGNKYNNKLDKVSEKYGLEKFKQDNLAKDASYLASVEQTYGSELTDKMKELRGEALTQKMQLAQETGLTTEEAYEKYLGIERDLWQKEQDLLISQGYSPTKLYDIKKQWNQQQWEALQQEEQEGKKLPQVYRMSEKQQRSYLDSVQTMNRQMQQNDVAAYGSRGASVLQGVYDKYVSEVQRIISEDETSQEEKDKALQQASQQANQELAQLKKTPQMRQMRVENTLDHIMQDPALQKASAEQREAFKANARPVLEEMFERANQIEESNLSEPEKRRQLQALQEEAQRRLSGGQ